jgi:tetratricopeptide (TPR) repeat protein
MSHRDRWRRERRPRRRPPKGATRPLPADLASRAAPPPEPEPPPAPPPSQEIIPQPREIPQFASAKDIWLVVALLVLAAVTFLPSLTGDFVWEDYALIVDNPLVRNLSDIGTIFSRPFLAARPNSYHPLVTLTYLADYQVWRLNPEGYHTTDLTLHLIATLLVYAAAMVLLRRRVMAFVAGALFAVHPVHVQAVAWTAGRAQPLATCLALFSFLAYVSYVGSSGKGEDARRRRSWYYGLALLAFTLALFAHAAACALLVLLPLYELALSRQRLNGRARPLQFALPYIGLAAGGGIYLLARWWALGFQLAPGLDLAAWPSHLYTIPLWAVRSLELLLLPVYSVPYYAAILVRTPLRVDVLTALAAVVVVVILVVRLRVIAPAAAFASWWALLMLAPTLNLVPVEARFAERDLYLPSAGIAMLAGWAVIGLYDTVPLRHRGWLRGAVILVLAWVVALGVVVSWQRGSWYRDEVAFFTRMTQAEPRLAMGHFNLGNAYMLRGDAAAAVSEYRRALRLRPTARIYHNLGNAYMAEGQYAEAADAYREALAREPTSQASADALVRALQAERGKPTPRGSTPPVLPQHAP